MKEGVNNGGAVHPESYRNSVLWNIEDCQQYGLVTEKNLLQPPMEKCIRNAQGETVSTSEYNAIKTTAWMLVNIHLVPLGTLADPTASAKTKTRTYYKKYLQNYKNVLDKLKAQESILTFCAAHWKAKHIIANCLMAIVDTEKSTKKKDAREVESDEPEASSARSTKRQRTKGESEPGSRKKKKKNCGDDGSKGRRLIDYSHTMPSTTNRPGPASTTPECTVN